MWFLVVVAITSLGLGYNLGFKDGKHKERKKSQNRVLQKEQLIEAANRAPTAPPSYLLTEALSDKEN